jgi:hypothetical protein
MSYLQSKTSCLVAYFLLLSAHIALIWSLSYVPTKDGPSHIYNLAILRDLLDGGEIWGTYYTHKLQLSPNLGFQIFAYPLLSFLDPWQTEKAFLSVYILLIGLSVPAYIKAFNRPVFPVSFFVFPVIFNYTLLMGFYSYCIAIPFFLMAFSLAWIIRYKTIHWKIPIYTLCGFLLYCLHLIPFVFYIIALFSICASEHFKGTSNTKTVLYNLISITPVLLLLLYHLLNHTPGTFNSFDYLLSLDRLAYLFADFISFSTMNNNAAYFIASALFLAVFWAIFLINVRDIYIKNALINILYSPYILLSLLLFAIYLSFPFIFAGGSYFNQRFPWVIFFLLLPLIRIPATNFFSRYASIIIVSSAIFVFVSNAAFIWKHSQLVSDYTKGLSVPITQNSFIMHHKKFGLDTSRVDFLLHAVSHYALVHKAVDAGNYEARLEYFPIRFSENLPSVPSSAQIELTPWGIDWNRYPDIDFLVAWKMTQDERKKIKQFFGLTFEDGNLSIWGRNQNNQPNGDLSWKDL